MIRKKLLLIAVNYGSDDSTLVFARSVFSQKAIDDISLVIVDNTERTDNQLLCSELRKISPQIVCLKSPDNLGYLGGARFGFENSNFRGAWVIVSNVDVEFLDHGFFSRLLSMNSELDRCGMIAPSIMSSVSKLELNPMLIERPSSKTMAFYKYVFSNAFFLNCYELGSRVKNRSKLFFKRNGAWPETKPVQELYAAQGSIMIFTPTYLRLGGDLQYPMFLFGEEIFFAERLRQMDLKIFFKPDLKCVHHEHVSTGTIKSRKIAGYVHESAVFLSEEFFT